MDHVVTLPELGEDAPDKAQLSFFYGEPGDPIEEGDSLAEMVTDKATFDVPCPVSGTVKELLVEDGDEVEVGGKLAVIECEG